MNRRAEISVEEMYQIEENGHRMGFLKKFMMENAGAAAVRRLTEKIDVNSKHVTIFAGLGNNGGDGLVMARHLAGLGAIPVVRLTGRPESIKTEESRWNWSILNNMSSVTLEDDCAAPWDTLPDVIIDAIFGTGITGRIREPYSTVIRRINETDCYKLAVDAPSGLDPQTGSVADICVKADMTVTFHRMKSGITRRRDLTGDLYVERIGIPPEAEEGVLS